MRLPGFVHGNDDFDASFSGYGFKLQYFPFVEQTKGFVGVDAGLSRVLIEVRGSDSARRQTQLGLGINFGWRFDLVGGLYLTPWLGLGYSFGADDVRLDRKRFDGNPWLVFPAVHVGYRFR